jgi:hypothetical protein
MPAKTKSLEVVAVSVSENGPLSYEYDDYEGSPLKAVKTTGSRKDERIAYILSQRAAVMP